MLNSGLIYPFGKDHEFRPILIFNPEILDVSDVINNQSIFLRFFFFVRKT